MDLVLRDGLERLVREGRSSSPCVSVYMPTGPSGSSREADSGLLRKLLQSATERLMGLGVSASKARSILQPAHELTVSPGDWDRASAALAMFVAPGFCRSFLLPARLEPLVRCGEHFAILPLVPLLEREAAFFFLFLGTKTRRLFAASGHLWRELELEGGADSPRAEATSMRGLPRTEEHEKDIDLRALDSAVRAHLSPADPLVLAGTREKLEAFRSASVHGNILKETVPVVPGHASPAQIHERAWTLVRPAIDSARAAAATSLGPRLAAGEATADMEQIAREAARGGRMDELYIAAEVCRNDTEDIALIEAAVADCLRHGTPVRVVPRQAMPGRCAAVAVLKRMTEGDRVET